MFIDFIKDYREFFSRKDRNQRLAINFYMASCQIFSRFLTRFNCFYHLETSNSSWVDTFILVFYLGQQTSVLLTPSNSGNGIIFNTLSGVLQIFRIDFWMSLTQKFSEYFIPLLFASCMVCLLLFLVFFIKAATKKKISETLQMLIAFSSVFFMRHLLFIPILQSSFGALVVDEEDSPTLAIRILAICSLVIIITLKVLLRWSIIHSPYSKRRPLDENGFGEYAEATILPIIVFLSEKSIINDSSTLKIVSQAMMICYTVARLLYLTWKSSRLSYSGFDRIKIGLYAFSFSFALEMLNARVRVMVNNFDHLDFPFLLSGCFLYWLCVSVKNYLLNFAISRAFNPSTPKKKLLQMLPALYSTYHIAQRSESDFIEKITPQLLFSLLMKQADQTRVFLIDKLQEQLHHSSDTQNSLPNPLLMKKKLE